MRNLRWLKVWLVGCFLLLALVAAPHAGSQAVQTRPPQSVTNVLVVTLDGMRWQEVFGGMTADLLTPKAGGVSDAARVQARFGGATPEERREKLLPWLWTGMAKQGQVFGDPSKGSIARVTNGLRFSYPGYNEISQASRTRASTATIASPIQTSPYSNGSRDARGSPGRLRHLPPGNCCRGFSTPSGATSRPTGMDRQSRTPPPSANVDQ